jgi:hypothetical protein
MDHGWAPDISPDGTLIAHGYEQVYVLNWRTGERRACPMQGTHYLAGWKNADEVGIVTDRVFTWKLSTNTIVEYPYPVAEGFGKGWRLGKFLSWVGNRLLLDGQDITPNDGIAGPTWDGIHYLYARPWSHQVMRKVSDGAIVREWDGVREWGFPHTLPSGTWMACAFQGQAEVTSPAGEIKRIAGEGRGPVVQLPSGEIICFTVTVEPFGAIGRPWNDFRKEAAGYWVPGMGHQHTHAFVVPDGILLAGFILDATATMTVQLIPFNAQRRTLPTSAPPPPPPAPVRPPDVQPTLPVNVPPFTSPRWFGLFFERNDARYPTAVGPGTCSVLTPHTSLGPAGPDTWGWPFFTRHGPPRKVIGSYSPDHVSSAVTVPDEWLIAVYWGLEGGPGHWSDDHARSLERAREEAHGRRVPLLVYMDGGYWSDEALSWASTQLDRSDIPLGMCYPHRDHGPGNEFSWESLDLSRDANRWRTQFDQLRALGFADLGLVRTMYTQTWNFPPAFIEQCQPVITNIANDYRVWCDLGFAWARPSGILQPWGDAPSIRPVLEPWANALEAASRASGRG